MSILATSVLGIAILTFGQIPTRAATETARVVKYGQDEPQKNPNSMPSESCADIVAYLLQANGAPPGREELMGNAATLKNVTIDVKESGQ